MAVKIDTSIEFPKTDRFLSNLLKIKKKIRLEKYGERGVKALTDATPKNTGKLANSWSYEVKENNGRLSLIFKNSDIEGGANIAILVQYGHATGSGYWVEGIDYINPALRPIFNEIADDIWREVKHA